MDQLSRLEKVKLREIWNHEAVDFTNWLAKEENLSLLAETLGLELELEHTEKFIGSFKADITCKDTNFDAYVLIENQLEKTDHAHLGQLFTYAAGLNKDKIICIWIAQRFREEHRAAIDWINEITSDEIKFFAIEIELWKIGSSNIAPKFNIVSKPNDWIKTTKTNLANTELSDIKKLQLEFWQGLKDYLEENNSIIQPRSPRAQHWTTFSIGKNTL